MPPTTGNLWVVLVLLDEKANFRCLQPDSGLAPPKISIAICPVSYSQLRDFVPLCYFHEYTGKQDILEKMIHHTTGFYKRHPCWSTNIVGELPTARCKSGSGTRTAYRASLNEQSAKFCVMPAGSQRRMPRNRDLDMTDHLGA